MKLVEVDLWQVMLSGITLNASITLKNPHQILAVMFELEGKPSHFEIQPERGMILQGEKKFIKLRLKPQLRKDVQRIEKGQNLLAVRATYHCEYNRKLLEKNSLGGWTTISKQFEENHLPIKFYFEEEVEKLKDSLKRGSSLSHSRKQNSFQKFRDSSIKRVKDPKLNEDLDFLFRNQDYGRLVRQERKPKTSRLSKELKDTPKNENAFKELAYSPKRKQEVVKTAHFIQTKNSLKGNPAVVRTGGSRTGEAVILAIVAALSLAIGEAVGSIFKGA